MRRLWLFCTAYLAACNELYGLDETQARPPSTAVSDMDEDGIPDDEDLCPGVADPAQTDTDGDRFGDACDFCPAIATALNHDEDADTHGDECDLCPSDADFQVDTDGDGVGDLCDNDFAARNKRLLFDPFTTLASGWERTGAWSTVGDAIAGTAGARLHWPGAVLDGTKAYVLDVGVTIAAPLEPEDQFGVELVDGDVVRVSCLARRHPSNRALELTLSPGAATTPFTLVPVTHLAIRETGLRLACTFADTYASDERTTTDPVFLRATVRLVGSPRVRFRYIGIWQ